MAKQSLSISVTRDADAAFSALKRAVEKLGYGVAGCDEENRRMELTTRVSAFSWGEKITASVAPDENGGSRVDLFSEPKVATNVADMGRGKRLLEALAKELEQELGGGEQADAVQPNAARSALSVADEIRELAKLRDEGILTEEEFTSKKRMLLGL